MRGLAETAKVDFLIANTSGVLAGPGRRLKAGKIAALQPDLLIGIGKDADLDSILLDHASLRTLRLSPSPEARRKTQAERRSARRDAFRAYFAEAGRQVFDRTVLDLREAGDRYPAGLLVGLEDAAGADIGLGIVLGRATPVCVDILTPAVKSQVHHLKPGLLLLGEDFSERALPLGMD